MDCLVFADDMTLITESMETTTIQINCLIRYAKKAGLQVSLEKFEFFTNVKVASEKMILDIGKIKRDTLVQA